VKTIYWVAVALLVGSILTFVGLSFRDNGVQRIGKTMPDDRPGSAAVTSVIASSLIEAETIIPAWAPTPGEICTLTFHGQMSLDGAAGLILHDRAYADKFSKYLNARDVDGFTEMFQRGQLIMTPEKSLSVRVLSVDQGSGWVEVRLPGDKCVALGNLAAQRLTAGIDTGYEGVVQISQLEKRQ
jgi:hypothetical protein